MILGAENCYGFFLNARCSRGGNTRVSRLFAGSVGLVGGGSEGTMRYRGNCDSADHSHLIKVQYLSPSVRALQNKFLVVG
jgi:hypothetical protein